MGRVVRRWSSLRFCFSSRFSFGTGCGGVVGGDDDDNGWLDEKRGR